MPSEDSAPYEYAQDRANAAATAIITELCIFLQKPGVRGLIAALLRDEIAEAERQVVSEIRLDEAE